MLKDQVVESGTFTKAKTLSDRLLAQALQNFSPVEVAYGTCYDGANQRTAGKVRKARKLRKISNEEQAMLDRDSGDVS